LIKFLAICYLVILLSWCLSFQPSLNIRGHFHQHFTSSFYVFISKSAKDWQLDCIFALLGSAHIIKAACKTLVKLFLALIILTQCFPRRKFDICRISFIWSSTLQQTLLIGSNPRSVLSNIVNKSNKRRFGKTLSRK